MKSFALSTLPTIVKVEMGAMEQHVVARDLRLDHHQSHQLSCQHLRLCLLQRRGCQCRVVPRRTQRARLDPQQSLGLLGLIQVHQHRVAEHRGSLPHHELKLVVLVEARPG